MSSNEFYSTYIADDNISELSERLVEEIINFKPVHVLEFGCGSGKNLRLLQDKGICATGIDISFMNIIRAHARNEIKNIVYGNETHLRHLCNFDVVFTCSVLDHIEQAAPVIQELKRIANKAVILAETVDVVGPYYYYHNYSQHGFKAIDFTWKSRAADGDGASYKIWIWTPQAIDHGPNDDLGCAGSQA